MKILRKINRDFKYKFKKILRQFLGNFKKHFVEISGKIFLKMPKIFQNM